ncbi:MAG: transglycosylase SLT domain-containing protein [Methylococcus sp.]|nr:transglycosylase SLT domain-containing protein [Methylococcus sp.]
MLTFPSVLAACAHSLPPAVHHASSHRSDEAKPPIAEDQAYLRLPSDIALLQDRLATRLWDGVSALENESEAARAQRLKARRVRTIGSLHAPQAGLVKAGKDGLWQRIRQRLILHAVQHDAVDMEIDAITRHPGLIDVLARRGEPFLHYLAGEIERKGLPMDVVIVPMVESAFDTQALSSRDAAGLWQIVRSTGEEHGLTVGKAYDGRYDIHASTTAALSYLKHLNAVFKGDWLLALAAYNAGEGAVQRAVEANRKAGRDCSFWALNLPAETRTYVPRILALSRIIASPSDHGVKLRKIDDAPILARVEIDAGVRVADAVAASGLPETEFFKTNPALKTGMQPPKRSYDVLLPISSAAALASNLEGTKLTAPQKGTGKRGVTLSALSKKSRQG